MGECECRVERAVVVVVVQVQVRCEYVNLTGQRTNRNASGARGGILTIIHSL